MDKYLFINSAILWSMKHLKLFIQEISKKFSNPRVYLQSSEIGGILEEHSKKFL